MEPWLGLAPLAAIPVVVCADIAYGGVWQFGQIRLPKRPSFSPPSVADAEARLS